MIAMETMRTGLFGYKKDSVCEYVAKLNDEFALRLQQQTAESRKSEAELQSALEELQQTNHRLTEEMNRQNLEASLHLRQERSDGRKALEELQQRLEIAEAEKQALLQKLEQQQAMLDRIREILSAGDETHDETAG